MSNPMFALGKLVATPGALAKLTEAGQQPMDFIPPRCRPIGAR